MKKVYILYIIFNCFLGNSILYANEFSALENENLIEIEGLILKGDIDSVNVLLNKIDIEDPYVKILKDVCKIDKPNYKSLYLFVNRIINEKKIQGVEVHNYLIKNLNNPSSSAPLNIEFVKIKWLQTILLTELVLMEEAEREFSVLNNYIGYYNKNAKNFREANFYKNTYLIVLETINRNLEEGKKICVINQTIANELNDTTLMIIANNYFSDFLLMGGELEEYITLCETNLELERELKYQTDFYYVNLCHLIDALLYKGNEEERVLGLINKVYEAPKQKLYSYSYYIQLIGILPLESEISKYILNKMEADNILDLSTKMTEKAKGKLPPNEYYQLLRLIAQTLFQKKYYEEAIFIQNKSIAQIRTIYTKDLSSTLATHKIRDLEEKKKYEISLEQEKSKRFLYITILLGVIVSVTIISIWSLRVRNKKISKRDEEKQLLLQEIHHRVKNNFQIVSSLLQLQTKGIKDPEALALAIEGQNRVKSMALIHEKLYQNDNLAFEIEGYVKSLINDINKVYQSTLVEVVIKIPETLILDIDTAIPLGLILNELITNAFKYAFCDSGVNKLVITCDKQKGNNLLTVSDNGQKSVSLLNKSKSIGLKLVKSLAKQLHGHLDYEYDKGSVFKVYFKDLEERKEKE